MVNKLFNLRFIAVYSFVFTVAAVLIVNFFNIPNPNVILLTVIVLFTFLGGFPAGIISGIIVIINTFYFFSIPGQILHYTQENLVKIIVVVIFVPIMVFLVGTLKAFYNVKNRELEQANRKLEKLLDVDPLTGIANRRFFDAVFASEFRNSTVRKTPISVAIIDIDFFKKYNDFYGHLSGDSCLRKVAKALESVVQRSGDYVARYGGEEFVIILPNTDQNGAKTVCTRILQAINSLAIPHEASTISPILTVSIGLATEDFENDCDCMDLVNRADSALYTAKNNGRNRIEYYTKQCEFSQNK